MTDTPEPPKKPKPAPRRSARPSAAHAAREAKPKSSKPKPKAAAPKPPKPPKSLTPSTARRARDLAGDAVKPENRGKLLGGVAAGLGAVGAIAAGVFLARRNRTSADAPLAGGTAHQADGTDSSAEFAAGIADEGMTPDKLPG